MLQDNQSSPSLFQLEQLKQLVSSLRLDEDCCNKVWDGIHMHIPEYKEEQDVNKHGVLEMNAHRKVAAVAKQDLTAKEVECTAKGIAI